MLCDIKALLAHYLSLSSLFDFVKRSLRASELYSWNVNFTKSFSSSSFYLTDDELETCLEYPELSSKPPPDRWPSEVNSANFDRPIYNNNSTKRAHDLLSHTNGASNNSNNVNPYGSSYSFPPDSGTGNSVASVKPAPTISTTVSLTDSLSTNKKGETKMEINADCNNSDSKSLLPSPRNASPVLPKSPQKSPKKSAHKLAKSESLSSALKGNSSQHKRNRSLVSGSSTPDVVSLVESSSLHESFQDLDSFTKVTKKQRQSKAEKKKRAFDGSITALSTASEKPKAKADESLLDDKGFKLVSKKSRRKKTSSIDTVLDKTVAAVAPTKMPKKPIALASHPPKGRQISFGYKLFMENETGVLAEIMDAALYNINHLSGTEPACLPRYSTSTSVNSSPAPIQWPTDSRFFAHETKSSFSAHEQDMQLCPPAWIMKSPQTNFSNDQLHLQNQPLPFMFQSENCAPPISPPQRGSEDGKTVQHSSVTSLSLSPPNSPPLSGLGILTMQRRNTRVTNSTLKWSVPAHMN